VEARLRRLVLLPDRAGTPGAAAGRQAIAAGGRAEEWPRKSRVFEHPKVVRALSVPARRPIKPVYVRKFVALIEDAQRVAAAEAMLRGKHDEP
jgi:hypothetical protein